MASLFAFFLVAAVSSLRCQADTNVSDYIVWQKTDIALQDRFFPRRALRQELLTNTAAQVAVSSLSSGLSAALDTVVAFQREELLIAKQLMAGTEAEGCVTGITNYINQSIEREVATYNDCAADALANLYRLNKTLYNTQSKYEAAYQRVQSGIDFCARIYPNKGSIDRLKACVEALVKIYSNASTETQAAVNPSPSLEYFTETVVGCASTAAINVAADGSEFLKLLLSCAYLSGTVNVTAYAEELDQWEGYNDTLNSQISTAISENYNQMYAVESEIRSYFDLQKQVLVKFVIDSRGLDYYINKTTWYLNDYYTIVNQSLFDNPGSAACAFTAKNELNTIVNIGANKSLYCDTEIVNNTKQLISTITNDFLLLNELTTTAGNVAILDCFSQGYVFAPNTIDDCFQLAYTEFDVDHDDLYSEITQDVTILTSYMDAIFNSSWLPCGSNLRRERLAANTTLYRLDRCLYESSGTVYVATTPIPPTTTTTDGPATTTSSEGPATTTTTEVSSTTTTTEGSSTTTTTEVPSTTTTTEGPSTTTTTEGPSTTTTTEGPSTTTTTEVPATTTTTEEPSTTTTTEAPKQVTTTEATPKTRHTRHTRRHDATTPITPTMGPFTSFLHKVYQFLLHFIFFNA